MTLRKAHAEEMDEALRLLDELELGHSRIDLPGLWIARMEGELVGVAHVEHLQEHAYVSSVGVRFSHRGAGIAKRLMEEIIAHEKGDLYLHTLIPAFFQQFGFEAIPDAQSPFPRHRNACEGCDLSRCVCMKRSCDVS